MIKLSKYLSFILITFIPLIGFSQDVDLKPVKDTKKETLPTYIGVSAGFGISNFRDFATSPLVYEGLSSYLGISHVRNSEEREIEFRISMAKGNFSVEVDDETAISSASFYNFYYSSLYKINRLNSEKWNFKAGMTFKLSVDYRTNESLQNNAIGIDMFSTLFATAKVSRDVSRTTSKDRKFLWINYRVDPRKRTLSYHLNIGVMNTTFRNGYSYTGQAQVINDTAIFDGYESKMFSGFRIGSELDYTIYLKNKNAVQLSYIWDAAKTGGDLDKFELAHHFFKVTLLFNTNNK